MVGHRVDWLDPVFTGLSYAGSYGLLWIGIAALVGFRRRSAYLPGVVLVMLSVGEASSYGLKLLIDRDRPTIGEPGNPEPLMSIPYTPSLPSGHATTAFLCATLLAFALPRLAVPLFALAAAVAWSRVYVGAHYPLDTLAGAVYGTALALAARALLRLAEDRRRSRRGPRPG